MLKFCDTTSNMKQSVGFRLTEEALRLLDALAANHGISRTAVLEMAIRTEAKKQGIPVRVDPGIQAESQSGSTSRDR
jgi:predicted transcriptional regulator